MLKFCRLAAVSGMVLVLGGWIGGSDALAQRFSDPGTTPPSPAPAPAPAVTPNPASPAPAPAPASDGENKRVGGSMGGFELPLSLYDEKANAGLEITRARDRAKKDNRRVLIMWGENRCEFCAYLNQLLTTDPRLKQLVETEYEWIKVDIGKFDKNIDLARQYGTPIDEPGFGAPALTIVEPTANQMISRAGGNEMVNKPMMPPNRVFNPDFVFNLLDGNKPQPKVAMMLVMESQQKAKREGKRVLAYFNIWGSDACRVFDKAANSAEGAAVLEKAYSIRKIDVERHIAGWDTLRRLKGSQVASPPWMTVLDAEGKPVAEAGTGHEFDPGSAEIENAVKWLVSCSNGKLNDADGAALAKALAEAAKPAEPKAEAKATEGTADAAESDAKK